jgi:hypothetical protein
MKKIVFPLILILTFPFFFSCDELEDLASFDLNTQSGIDREVTISENDPLTFSTSFTVSLANNPDIQDYIDKIQEYRINKVTYQIRSFSAPTENDVLLSGVFKVGSVEVDLEKVNLTQMHLNGTIATLDLTDQELIEMAKSLESGQSISGSLAGEVTSKPVYFQVYIEFDLSLRVSG